MNASVAATLANVTDITTGGTVVNVTVNTSLPNVTNAVSSVNSSIVSNGVSLVQTIDPNWLYSTLAQSSAAIVGLMGAFLTTKLITIKSQMHQLEREIQEHHAQAEHLKKSIEDKESFVAQMDEEDAFDKVKEFLEEKLDEMDVDTPTPIDQLIDQARESMEYHDINIDMLTRQYPKELAEKKKRRDEQRRLGAESIFMTNPITLPSNAAVTVAQRNRYDNYADDIDKVKLEIDYQKRFAKQKEKELADLRSGFELKSSWGWLTLFSLLGVFLPISMLATSPATMLQYRWVVLAITAGAWFAVLWYLLREILSLRKRKNASEAFNG